MMFALILVWHIAFANGVAHDGDTIRIDHVSYRLLGIDAPELNQQCLDGQNRNYPCGEYARDYLIKIIANNPVNCVGVNKDKYGRTLATCFANGIDLNAAMLEGGWAVPYYNPPDSYLEMGEAAKAAKKGVWQGTFELPSDWRHGKITVEGQ